MRQGWLIRHKLLLGVAMMCAIVAILAFSSIRGVYAYRELARSISYRQATELRLASELSYDIGELRAILSRTRVPNRLSPYLGDGLSLREEFRNVLFKVQETFENYKKQLDQIEDERSPTRGPSELLAERQSVAEIEAALQQIALDNDEDAWAMNRVRVEALDASLAELHLKVSKLPHHLQERMRQIVEEVRGQYRTWIALTWGSIIAALTILPLLFVLIYRSVFRPLETLLAGSRRVSIGRDFDHRIELNTGDEIAELAEAMNAMTAGFQQVRDDLDQQIRERDEQVRQRTKAIVRSEKMASLGLLSAGVAHEINNPLASIAWSAEALEMRLHEIIQQDDNLPDEEHNEEIGLLRDYLRRIQDEAFRCKGITDRLLDFSRLGDSERHNTDLAELVEGVIEMVRHLGRYREKKIEFSCNQAVLASVNPQEIKQVVLNLITNALDSLDSDGTVYVHLRRTDTHNELEVRDEGCGMTDEVIQHVFEPFFTRRRGGQGTGLGLSIAFGIIQDHGGEIVPSSNGPGCGSTFLINLPLATPQQEQAHETQSKVA